MPFNPLANVFSPKGTSLPASPTSPPASPVSAPAVPNPPPASPAPSDSTVEFILERPPLSASGSSHALPSNGPSTALSAATPFMPTRLLTDSDRHPTPPEASKPKVRCSNCRSRRHKTVDCKKPRTCFKCSAKGHIWVHCTAKFRPGRCDKCRYHGVHHTPQNCPGRGKEIKFREMIAEYQAVRPVSNQMGTSSTPWQ